MKTTIIRAKKTNKNNAKILKHARKTDLQRKTEF